MCEFFIVILNQLAMDGSPFPFFSTVEQLHAKLINEIGFTLIQNIILLFVQRLSMDPMHSHIVELCFIYLLRLFGNHPADTIRQHATEVVPLLHFLYECLYKPCFLPVDENDETLTTGGFTQIQTQSNVLMDYVMTLFALLCYNSTPNSFDLTSSGASVDHPSGHRESDLPATQLAAQYERDSLPPSIPLLLHALRPYLRFHGPSPADSLLNIIVEPNNLRLFLDHLRQYPSEPLLRVTFLLIQNSPAVIDSLISLQLPSLLIGLLASSDDASSVMSLGKEGVKDSRDIAARVRLLTLHLLHAFFRDKKCLKLVDTQLFFSLLNLIEAFIYSTEPLAPQIITISTALLLASLSHSASLGPKLMYRR